MAQASSSAQASAAVPRAAAGGGQNAGAAVAGTSGEKPKGLSKAREEIPKKNVEPKAPVNVFAALGVDSDSD